METTKTKAPLSSELSSSSALITGDEWYVLSFLVTESKEILSMQKSMQHHTAIIGTLFTLLLLRHNVKIRKATAVKIENNMLATKIIMLSSSIDQHSIHRPQTYNKMNLVDSVRELGRCMQTCSQYHYTYYRGSCMTFIDKCWGVSYKHKSVAQYRCDLYQFISRCITESYFDPIVYMRDTTEISVLGRKKYTLIEHNCVRDCSTTTTHSLTDTAIEPTTIGEKRKRTTSPPLSSPSCLEHLLELCVHLTDLDAVPNPVVDVVRHPCCVEH